MASPAAHMPAGDLDPPAADPVAIRECLSLRLVAEFDAEWERVLDQAKVSKDLAGVRTLLQKWRHLAYAELRDPGSYYRMLAKAEQIMRTGHNNSAGSYEDMQALIQASRSGWPNRWCTASFPTRRVFDQVAALPIEAVVAYAEVLDVLQLSPWNGDSQHENNPDAPVRRWHFGPRAAGQVVYLIVENPQEVHVLLVQWLE